MRTIVDLPDDDIKMLDHMAARMKKSRAELVRRSVAAYLEKEGGAEEITNDIYGLYGDVYTKDALETQEDLRADWDKRDGDANNWSLHEPDQPPYKGKKKP